MREVDRRICCRASLRYLAWSLDALDDVLSIVKDQEFCGFIFVAH